MGPTRGRLFPFWCRRSIYVGAGALSRHLCCVRAVDRVLHALVRPTTVGLLAAAVAVGVPILTFLMFEIWFLVPLPKGPLGEHAGILKIESRAEQFGGTGNKTVRRDECNGRYRQSFSRLCGGRAAVQSGADGRRHRAWRHRRRAARSWRRQWRCNPAAADVFDVADLGDHHAVLHLLGSAVRRRHHLDPVQHTGRTMVGGDHVRRLSDGAERKRRRSADRRVHFVFRWRAVRRDHHYVGGAAGREFCVAVRSARNFLRSTSWPSAASWV